jgi:hypothetical protein
LDRIRIRVENEGVAAIPSLVHHHHIVAPFNCVQSIAQEADQLLDMNPQ